MDSSKPYETALPFPKKPKYPKYQPANQCTKSDISEKSETVSRLLETLSDLCRNTNYKPYELYQLMDKSEIHDWATGKLTNDDLKVFIASKALNDTRKAGKIPESYLFTADCAQCGVVWSPYPTVAQHCPWCTNRLHALPIPRPESIRCIDCKHFQRIEHPCIGKCKRNQSGGLVGRWGLSSHRCAYFIPNKKTPP